MLTWAFLAGKHIFNGQICSWHMQCLDWGQNDFSRHFREDRRDIRKISLPKKTVLFLENGYGSWQSPRMGADTLAGLPPCRHLMRPQFGSLCVRLPVSTRQRRRTRVAVEVISLEYMMLMLAGWWSSVLMLTRAVSALEWPQHWTGEKLPPGFLDSGLAVPARPASLTARYLGSSQD